MSSKNEYFMKFDARLEVIETLAWDLLMDGLADSIIARSDSATPNFRDLPISDLSERERVMLGYFDSHGVPIQNAEHEREVEAGADPFSSAVRHAIDARLKMRTRKGG